MAKELYPMELKAVRVRAEKLKDAEVNAAIRIARAKEIHERLIQFAEEGALDILEFTHREKMTHARLKKMAAEDPALQEALDYAKETIAMNLRATWRNNPQFKDYAHANVAYNDLDYREYRKELAAQIAAKTTGASTTLHITSDSLGMVASKEKDV